MNPIDTQAKLVGLSNNYKFVDSSKLIQVFQDNGLQLVKTTFGIPRKHERRGFQKHIMRFTSDALKIDSENNLELLATNSHDGRTSLILNIGVYRLVCANGLVVGSTIFESKVRHLGNTFNDRLDKSIQETLRVMPIVAQKIEQYRSIMLDQGQQLELAERAAKLKLASIDNVASIDLASVLRVRREADRQNDLFTVYNRVQEAVIRGGIKYSYNKEDNGVITLKNNTTRGVKGISGSMELNKGLWTIADSYAQVA